MYHFVHGVEVEELTVVGIGLPAKSGARRHQTIGVFVGKERKQLTIGRLQVLEDVDLQWRPILGWELDATLE